MLIGSVAGGGSADFVSAFHTPIPSLNSYITPPFKSFSSFGTGAGWRTLDPILGTVRLIPAKCLSCIASLIALSWATCLDIPCYACQLGELTEARMFFQKAFQIDDARALKTVAREDSDLKALYE